MTSPEVRTSLLKLNAEPAEKEMLVGESSAPLVWKAAKRQRSTPSVEDFRLF